MLTAKEEAGVFRRAAKIVEAMDGRSIGGGLMIGPYSHAAVVLNEIASQLEAIAVPAA
jgi:hypothetical protein